MIRMEHQVPFEELELGFEFDVNAAFLEAIEGVATSEVLELDEKVARMEHLINEGSSELFRDFVDFRMMASQIEAFCSHDHALNQSLQSSGLLSNFRSNHGPEDSHNHLEHSLDTRKDNDSETGPKTDKKKKKKRKSWFGFYY